MVKVSSKNDPRYVRTWKCQVSVGELYRWILAKLSDKDIKRALHKYRDLMPRQSDWNRKLTQATNMPELGFRYLYRCGQIDESNHRTMQKMLKYIDRQDVIPYFETILCNTNYANCSLKDLQNILLDKVSVFLQLTSSLSDDEIHPDSVYEIQHCRRVDPDRMTRSSSKRKTISDHAQYSTVAKRIRHSNGVAVPHTSDQQDKSTVRYHTKARSALVASALNGPVIHTMISTSLLSILTALRMTLDRSPSCSLRGSDTDNDPFKPIFSHSRLLAAVPHLLMVAGLNPLAVPPLSVPASLNPSPSPIMGQSSFEQQPIPMASIAPRVDNTLRSSAVPVAPGQMWISNRPPGGAILFPLLANPQPRPPVGDRGNAAPFIAQLNLGDARVPTHQPANGRVHVKQVVMSSGGIGLTASPRDSLIRYYCNLKLRVLVDCGPPSEALRQIQTDRQEFFEQQIHRFMQVSNVLNSRFPGEFICYLRFTQLSQLESFWRDYLSGDLKKILKAMLMAPVSRSFIGRSPVQHGLTSPAVAPNDPGNLAFPRALQPQLIVPPWMNIAPFPPNQLNRDAMNVPNPWLFPAAVFAVPGSWSDNLSHPRVGLVSCAQPDPCAQDTEEQDKSLMDLLADAIETIRAREPSLSTLPPNCDLNLFVSRREYENGRMLLVRNLRAIPSLCQLVAASSFLPSFDSAILRGVSDTAASTEPASSLPSEQPVSAVDLHDSL